MGQDLEQFFDSIRVQSLDVALERLGAPRALRALVDSFYGRHFRLFSYAGFLGGQWHQVTAGGWHCSRLPFVTVDGGGRDGWLDSTACGCSDPVPGFCRRPLFLKFDMDECKLLQARALSDGFDLAMGFVCDRGKCQVAHQEDSVTGPALALRWGYAHGTSLKTLGVRIDMHGECQAALLKFTTDL